MPPEQNQFNNNQNNNQSNQTLLPKPKKSKVFLLILTICLILVAILCAWYFLPISQWISYNQNIDQSIEKDTKPCTDDIVQIRNIKTGDIAGSSSSCIPDGWLKIDHTIYAGTPTKDWQIYKNKKYNFEFKYLPEWKIEDKINPTDCVSAKVDCVKMTGSGQNYNFSVNYIENKDVFVPSYCEINLNKEGGKCEGFGLETGENIIIDWENSAKIFKDGKGFVLFEFDKNSVDEKYKSNMRVILSTFKFISTSTQSKY